MSRINKTTPAATPTTRPRNPYLAIFTVPGAKAFSASAALARLPMSMMSLGIVLAINHIYDNWTSAGAISAGFVLATALVTPIFAKLFDRYGQRRVGLIAIAIQIAVMLAFAFATLERVPLPALFALAIVTGATQFSFGALVRTRWTWVLRKEKDPGHLTAAYAFESAIDEFVFVVGPILAAALATAVHPVAQLFVPVAFVGIGGLIYFSLGATQPAVLRVEQVDVSTAARQKAASAARAGTAPADATPETAAGQGRPHHATALAYPGMIMLIISFTVYNMGFSAYDVSVTALTKSMGKEALVGLVLAFFALGSLFGALIYGSRQWKLSLWSRYVLFMVALAIGYVGFNLASGNLVLLCFVEVAAGMFVSPLFATANMIVKGLVPSTSLTEGLSWLSTGCSIGSSIGSTFGGMMLDHFGVHGGLAVPVISVVAAMPLALLCWLGAHRRAARAAA